MMIALAITLICSVYLSTPRSIPAELLDFWKLSVDDYNPIDYVPPLYVVFGIEINGFLCRAYAISNEVNIHLTNNYAVYIVLAWLRVP